MTIDTIRSAFFDVMKKNGHHIVPSSSLVPLNDPTTLFTGSGMQSMIPYLLGEKHPLGKRIANSQKSFRSQDIEEVGDNRHTTFFEMLGNWSLGDYFKEEQIDHVWDFLINKIKLDPTRIYVSCYSGNTNFNIPTDTVSEKRWCDLFSKVKLQALSSKNPEQDGMKEGVKIFFYEDKKNWWSRSGEPAHMPVGEPGGADTEMFYDFDPVNAHQVHERSDFKNQKCHPNCDCGRFLEIGNSVFMEYVKTNDGIAALPQRNVDFGGGLERLVCAVENTADIFSTSTFAEAKKIILENVPSHITYKTHTTYMRIILDHVRAAVFLIGDGVLPGKSAQQYFVRRLLRRSMVAANAMQTEGECLVKIADIFIQQYADSYDTLKKQKEHIVRVIADEEKNFTRTLSEGLKKYKQYQVGGMTNENAFDLYQTYGFPLEVIFELAELDGVALDKKIILNMKEQHSLSSRTASQGMFKGGLADTSAETTALHTVTHLLLAGLRSEVSEEIHQAGCNITHERIRFDFTFKEKLTDEQVRAVENYVNNALQKGFQTHILTMSKQKALDLSVEGSFWEKYPDEVTVYELVGNDGTVYSRELCGGPHINNCNEVKTKNGAIPTFVITKQEASSQGIRRVKAVLQ
ncbi:MAG: alanine--tRNA ligase-related protein [Alphaproteobacteria bacterium]|nr:alanine--tRNA ligase-related protein [Alphaproteobacteria bacterium]